MKRSWVGLMGLTVLLAGNAVQAQQQYPMQVQQQMPTYQQPQGGPNGNGTMGWAPWLNMLNNSGLGGPGPGNTSGNGYGNTIPGAGAAIQYFGIVRPEQQSFQNYGQLQGQVSRIQMQSQVGPPRNQGIADTGVPAGFMNYGSYFSNVVGRQRMMNQGGR